FGIDLEKLMYDNQFYIELLRPVDIKMMAKNESIKIFELSQAYKASKIVIDSFNYISEAFDNTYEKMTYSLKILNDISNYCPMLITTYDIRKKDLGKFNLEYLSDINLILDYYYDSANNYIKRYLIIQKARGAEIKNIRLDFEIKNNAGFVFSPTNNIPNVKQENKILADK
ncbi:MAG: ATPase domain-containing protein, partial [Candidatus Anstonellales archaeon]